MNRVLLMFCLWLVATTGVGNASVAVTNTFDFTGFEPISALPESISFTNGTIEFRENFADAAMYYYNHQYAVAPDAETLSFSYDLQLGPNDFADSLEFGIERDTLWNTATTSNGYFEIDMTPYRGQTLSMNWGLIWNGDGSADSIGTISNVNLTTSPVPIPPACFLLASGLIGMFAMKRKRH